MSRGTPAGAAAARRGVGRERGATGGVEGAPGAEMSVSVGGRGAGLST